MAAPNTFFRGERGSAAAEFALVAPMFFALAFAVINMSAMLFAYADLHWATQDAARCYAVRTTVCSDNTTTQTYAGNRYVGPGIGASFTAGTAGQCHKSGTTGLYDGHTVAGSGNYTINVVVTSVSVPLASAACFP